MPAVRPIPAQYVSWDASGKLTLASVGANQNVVVIPTGSGFFNVTSESRFNDVMRFNSAGAAGHITWGAGAFTIVAGSAFPILAFQTAGGTEAARFLANQRFLIGATSDSSNGIAQTATHTAQTGGYGLGADAGVYRAAGGLVRFTQAAAPAITGARGGNAALASLLTALATAGLVTDSTTA